MLISADWRPSAVRNTCLRLLWPETGPHTVINPSESSTEQTEPRREIDWKLCVLCRTTTSGPLVCPANSKRKDAGAGYKTLALLSLSDLQELDENPSLLSVATMLLGTSHAETILTALRSKELQNGKGKMKIIQAKPVQ